MTTNRGGEHDGERLTWWWMGETTVIPSFLELLALKDESSPRMIDGFSAEGKGTASIAPSRQ